MIPNEGRQHRSRKSPQKQQHSQDKKQHQFQGLETRETRTQAHPKPRRTGHPKKPENQNIPPHLRQEVKGTQFDARMPRKKPQTIPLHAALQQMHVVLVSRIVGFSKRPILVEKAVRIGITVWRVINHRVEKRLARLWTSHPFPGPLSSSIRSPEPPTSVHFLLDGRLLTRLRNGCKVSLSKRREHHVNGASVRCCISHRAGCEEAKKKDETRTCNPLNSLAAQAVKAADQEIWALA